MQSRLNPASGLPENNTVLDGRVVAGAVRTSVQVKGDERDLGRLRERLVTLQNRLGTPLETCADLEEAREITHALRNYVQLRILRRSCEESGMLGWAG